MKVTRQPFDPGPAAWNALLPSVNEYPRLEGEQTADVVIIGAGFAGLSAARRLHQLDATLDIAILEARRVGEGPAGRNSGFMIDLPHNLVSSDYVGAQDADLQQIAMNREAIGFAQDAATELNMSEEAFVISGKVNAAATDKGTKHNKDYAHHLVGLNEQHEWLDERAMRELSGSAYYQSGLYTPGTAMIQPALYVRHLASGVSQNGVRLFEMSPVISFSQASGGWEIVSPLGKISAKKIILCTNGHAESFGYFKRQLMHIYLYASMTKALTKDEIKKLRGGDRWGFTPADPLGTTVRKISGTGGDRIVIRNRFTWAPNRTVSESKLENIGQTHDRSFKQRFPNLTHVGMEYRWGGLLCLTRNTVPAFGELEDGIISACCQNGLGTVNGTLSGKLAAELLLGKNSVSLTRMLNSPKPKPLPPEPFASVGANAFMRWGEFKAEKEL